jgi:hypothetical protein
MNPSWIQYCRDFEIIVCSEPVGFKGTYSDIHECSWMFVNDAILESSDCASS